MIGQDDALGKGLHIAHLNIRSIMGGHSFDLTKHQIRNSNVDFFTLSETWLSESIPNEIISIEGYNVTRLDRNWNDLDNLHSPKRGGGLACYVKKGIEFSDSIHANLNVSCKDLEMMWLKVSINKVRPIVIVTIYRPPQGNYTRCCEIIGNAFDRANLKDNTDIFLLGDFNINFSDKKSPSYRELSFTTQSLGLRQLILSPTRVAWRQGTATNSIIDLIFTNSVDIAQAKTLDLNLSDHMAVLATRKKSINVKKRVEFKGRSYRNYDRVEFQERLIAEDWGPFFESNDPVMQWEFMEKSYL